MRSPCHCCRYSQDCGRGPSWREERPPLGTQPCLHQDRPLTLPRTLKPLRPKSYSLSHRPAAVAGAPHPGCPPSKDHGSLCKNHNSPLPGGQHLVTVVAQFQHAGPVNAPPQQAAPGTLYEPPLGMCLSNQRHTTLSRETTIPHSLVANI